MSAHPDVAGAVEQLRAGALVAFPTETVYGLGADATNVDALRLLYAVKGRPPEHPVIVHVSADATLDRWAVDVPDVAYALAAAYWPGPLTLVLQAAPQVSRIATGGLDTVGIRVPSHPLACELLDAFGGGIAAPSANRFGKVSPTTAAAVRSDLGEDVGLVLDGGPCTVGVESTIVDCTGPTVHVLRPGAVTVEEIAAIVGGPPTIGGTTRAPGTLLSHYAPTATVELVNASELAMRAHSRERVGDRVGVLALGSDIEGGALPPRTVTLATVSTVEAYAQVLYAALRKADAIGVDVVFAVAPPAVGIGAAVGDRLRRAAGGR